MLEYFAIPALAIVAAAIPKRKKKDRVKIQQVFENRKLGINKGDYFQYPKLVNKTDKELYSVYVYSLPYGVPSDAVMALLPSIEEALNKSVEYEFEHGVLKLYVYHQSLPERWNYEETLLRPGKWEIPVGKNHKGVLYHDFEKYQHMLVGGVTRYGKTVFLKNIFNTLVLNNPDDIEVYILDLKAGLEFHKFIGLDQVKEVACDVYESAQVLAELTAQLKEDEVYFRNNHFSNIADTPIKKRRFIIVDEGAELSPNIVKNSLFQEKDGPSVKKYAEFCQGALSEIARIGGGLGYRLIYCTQYPTKEAVPMQIKMNIVSRVAFLCASQVASRVLLDEVGAEDLPAVPGRCIYQVDKRRIVQAPYIDDKQMFKMMEVRKDELTRKSRKDVSDNRPTGGSQNQTPTKNT